MYITLEQFITTLEQEESKEISDIPKNKNVGRKTIRL